MKTELTEVVSSNPRIDLEVVRSASELQDRLPESMRPSAGADYRLGHPLSRKALASIKRKESEARAGR